MNKKEFSYLALGDSYTIGESVAIESAFPNQLARLLYENKGVSISKVKIVAKTGWTTTELQEGIKRAKIKSTFDLVTLLIGVNNQYRSYDISQYKTEFNSLLDQAISFAGDAPKKVVVVSIPDYGSTPFGAEMAEKIENDLKQYNSIAFEIAIKKGCKTADIYDISKRAKTEPELIAADKLHPSALMYTLWAERIYPVAERNFE
jgi:lysophospholipase L1-like esterase